MSKDPLNIMEATVLWESAMTMKLTINANKIMLNHAKDEDLKKYLTTKINKVDAPILEQMESMLEQEGISLENSFSSKPSIKGDLPAGSFYEDIEIAQYLTGEIKGGLIGLSGAMASFTREDLATQFVKFHSQCVDSGRNLLKLMKKKDWLIVPPKFKQ
ncbi:DUF3231 family protein [Proteinivorax hydrogeniformans]|uniref:DUF3231 family protein n=1 Tax=Proteinivorax hydrogeniformans TaxID=1826727 RepID=A0AAU8HW03_9FIRM